MNADSITRCFAPCVWPVLRPSSTRVWPAVARAVRGYKSGTSFSRTRGAISILRQVCKHAVERGSVNGRRLRVWLDDTNIPAGASIPKRIEDGLRDRQRFGIPMTRNYFASNSGWTEPEWHSALFQDPDNRTRKLLPLLAGECDVPFLLAPHRHPRQDTPSVRRRSNYRSLATRRFEDSCVARRTALRERFPTTSTRHSLAMCLRSRAAPASSTLRTLPRTYYHAEAPGCRKVASRCCRGRRSRRRSAHRTTWTISAL